MLIYRHLDPYRGHNHLHWHARTATKLAIKLTHRHITGSLRTSLVCLSAFEIIRSSWQHFNAKFPSDIQQKHKVGPRSFWVQNTKTAVHDYWSQQIWQNTAEMLARPEYSLVIWHSLGTVLRRTNTIGVHTCQWLSFCFLLYQIPETGKCSN